MKKLNLLLLILVFLFIINCSKKGIKTITMAGSTTVLPIAQACAEEYMEKNSKVNISVRGGGSSVGIKSILEGSIDIGNASRKIKDIEAQDAEEKGVSLREIIVAYDAIAIIVNKTNNLSEISSKNLKKIYLGEVKNWKELGGADKEIVVVSRDVSSGTYETFENKIMEKNKVVNNALMLASNNAVLSNVKTTEGAIGYIGFGYLNDEVKALKMDGVYPNKEDAKNGNYKISRALYMYTNSKASNETINNFVDFILSKIGQSIVEKQGFIKIN